MPPPSDRGTVSRGERLLPSPLPGWLRAELALRAKQVEGGSPESREAVRKGLQDWTKDTDLAGLRNGALDRLPAGEREEWNSLWAEVGETAKKAGEGVKK